MSLKALFGAVLATCALLVPASAGTGAKVYCWAPHLSSPILLDSHGQGIGSYAGRPYGYKILGVAGSLALGDQCDGAFPDSADPLKRFRQGWWSGGLGSRVDISSHVKLQVNWAQFYPKRLEVKGDRPGATTGPVRLYGDVWNCTTMFGYPEVTLVFHLAGAGDYQIPNRNPNGFFYVVAEYNLTAPQVTGTLNVSSQPVLRNNITPVGYKINRSGGTTTTPPFTGYDPSGEVVFLTGQ
ncbi:hypothetical protein OJ996_10180 [Luteolibacter sp. GHJ8]|uniref:Uncharacterized protein n=1 Tax=Luteolibacter rhizosphaerae TaxID=2989719 RepID=A0ABT3G327_9BACT|nr:hypothetical protein [Luteolibacter rhizosphaerae]MCW1913944.1 hypothetical protein [Luteolibacter rhizosphaerae]